MKNYIKIFLIYTSIFLGFLFLGTDTFLNELNDNIKLESKVKFVYGAF